MAIQTLARWVLSALFIFGGALKVFSPEEMRQAIEGFQFVTGDLAVFGAYFIPWFELTCGVSLFFDKTRTPAAFLLTCLIALFTLATLLAWHKGVSLHCGCFGTFQNQLPDDYRILVIRNIGLMVLGSYVCWRSIGIKKP